VHLPGRPGHLGRADQGKDSDGLSDTDDKVVKVTVDNKAPTATFNAPDSVGEGEDVEISLTGATDPAGNNDTIEYRFKCGEVDWTAYGTATTHVCPTTDDGDVVVKGQVRDEDGGEKEYQKTVTVNNAKPSVAAAADQSADEGEDQGFKLGSFTDPGSDGDWTVTVDWGDDSPDTTFTANSTGDLPDRNHAYADDGAYTVAVTVAEDGTDAPSGSATFKVTVANLAPTATAQPVETRDGVPKTITLVGRDPGSDDLSLEITTPPAHGKLYKGQSTASTDEIASGDLPYALTGNEVTYAPDAGYDGPDAFDFKADDGTEKSAAATVSITVTEFNDPPVADDDSATTAEDTAVTIDVIDGDSPGAANESGQTLTVSKITTDPAHGTAEVIDSGDDAGKVRYAPAADYNGPDSFEYEVCDDGTTNRAADPKCDTATVNVTVNPVNDAPVADDETFDGTNGAVGNTSLVVNDPDDGVPDPSGPQKTITGDILDGDTDVNGDPLAVQAGTFDTNDGGTVDIEADGDFTFHPKTGTSCSDHSDFFDYTVTDSHPTDPKTDTGRVTIDIQECVWYVDAGAGAPPAATAGSSHTPLNSLSGINGVGGAGDSDGAGDRILLYPGTYTGGLPLEVSQQLVSKRHGLTVPDGGAGNVTLETPNPGGRSQVNGGVVLATENTVQGVDLGTTGSASVFALSGSSVGTATVNSSTSGDINNPAGGAVNIGGTDNTLNIRLGELTSSGSSTNAVLINNATGTLSAQSGTLSNATGTTFNLGGGAAVNNLNVTLNGSISDDAGRLMSISGQTGGTKDFNGPVNDNPSDGDGGGISLQSNSATTTTRFDGGLNLSTGPNNGLVATSGGTVAVPDPAGSVTNTLTSTTGTPLNLAFTRIHDDDLVFEKISSNGAQSGIVLNTTSNANGRLVVTSNGVGSCNTSSAACTGGAILNSTLSGINLNSVPGGASLTRMYVLDASDDGVRATDAGSAGGNGMTLNTMRIESNGNSVVGGNEDRGIDWLNVKGPSSITNSVVTANFESNAVVKNSTSGTLDLDVSASTFSASANNIGLQILGAGTATMNVDVVGPNTFSGNRDSEFQLQSDGATTNATMNLNFTGNTVTGNPAVSVAGQPGIYVSPGGNTQTKARIANNTVSGTKGTAIIAGSGATTAGSTTNVTVENNTIGTTAAGSGSQQGDGIQLSGDGSGTKRVIAKNNDVQQWANKAIRILSGDVGGGMVDFTVTGNNLHNGGASRTDTIALVAGRASVAAPESVCANVGGPGAEANTFGGTAGAGSFDMTISARFATTLNLYQYTTGSDEQAYIRSRNNGNPTVVNIDNPLTGTNTPCTQPTLPPSP
jgi:hypothetical protein